jgi:hypothetical protein
MKTEAILQNEFVSAEPAVPPEPGICLKFAAPRELARKARLAARMPPGKRVKKMLKISLDGTLHLVHIRARKPPFPHNLRHPMPNVHSPDKEPLSMQIPRTLMGRLKLKARRMGMSVPSYVTSILTHETKDIALTSNDYEAIARATRQAERTGTRCATRFDDPA